MTYRVVLTKAAERDLRSIRNRAIRRRLSESIEALANDRYPHGAVKLRGANQIWRIRVGEWRVCYTVQADVLVVLILTIAQRGDVYQRLRRRLE